LGARRSSALGRGLRLAPFHHGVAQAAGWLSITGAASFAAISIAPDRRR